VLVTALNSAPVIFYPTDTFAELEDSPRFFSAGQTQTGTAKPSKIMHAISRLRKIWIAGRLSAAHYSHCRYCGRVFNAVLEMYGARGSNPREGLTGQVQPLTGIVPECRRRSRRPKRDRAGGQTGTGRGAVNGQR